MYKEIKPFLIATVIIAILFIGVSVAFAAPYFRQEAGLVPITDSTYYLGTTTPSTIAWLSIITDQLCLTADVCRTTWPGGLSSYDAWTHPSAGVSATTSSMIFTNASSTFTGNLNITGNSTTTNATTTNFFATTASSTNLFTSIFTLNGFTLSATANATIGGTNTGDVTLAGTPDYLTISGQQITRTKLDISDDTNATGGVGLTLTANDFACDTASGTIFGCLTSTDWTIFNSKESALTFSTGLTR